MAGNKTIMYLLGAGVVAAFILSRKGQIAKNAQFSFEKIGISLARRKVLVTLGISNPAQGSIKINSVVGQLKVNGRDIAAVENFRPVQVRGNAKTMLPLELSPSGAGIVDLIKSYIAARKAKGQISAKVTFVGSSNVDGLTMPIKTVLL
jgi:LEA14-like dessication related protein